MKFIYANDTYVNVGQILWVESRKNAGGSETVVTIQFADKKLTWTGAMASAFMKEWYEVVAPPG